MNIVRNAALPLAILFLSTTAHGEKTPPPDSGRPVVAVMNLKVESENPGVQAKIVELTAKVRDQVASSTESCEVINTKRMNQLARQNRKAIESCYDDCDVEFGILVGAQFVIVGNLEPSDTEIIATLEIRDTRTRNPIASRKVKGANYFELESSLLATVKRFVRPLNNVVRQATDDEVLADEPPVEEETPEPSSQPSSSQPSSSQPPSSSQSQQQLDYVPEERPPAPPEPEQSPWEEKWTDAKEEPRLADSEGGSFIKQQDPRRFGLGFNVGYSINVSRADGLKDLTQPLFHMGVEALYQFHPLFQVAIVGDMDFMRGQVLVHISEEGMSSYPGISNTERYEDNIVVMNHQYNFYTLNKYFTGGVRPVFRFTLPIHLVEFYLGAGIGLNYVSTEGTWQRKRSGVQYLSTDQGVPPADVSQDVTYYFTQSGLGFGAVLEAAFIIRVLKKHLGLGVLMQYKKASMWASGSKMNASPDEGNMEVTIKEQNQEEQEVSGSDSPFRPPSGDDLKFTPLRHLDSLHLLTFGLTVDWRF